MIRDVDVAVIGGGSAGLAAAITAARGGARVMLLERQGFLGGMGTASLVHTFCGLYLLKSGPGAELANPGFPTEMAERMIETTGLGPIRMGRLDVLPQHPADFVRIADDLVKAEPNLVVQWHTEVIGLRKVDGRWQIDWACRGSIGKTFCTALVDASGDAVTAEWIGALHEVAPRLQRPAYVFGIQGVESFPDEARLALAGKMVEGIRAGVLSKAAMGLSFRASGRPGELFGTLDLAGGESESAYDPLDPVGLSELEAEGRRVASSVVSHLRESDSSWSSAIISQWPSRAGIRESRRWVGRACLTGKQIEAGTRFEDEIALATWPMELRESARGPKWRFPIEDRPTGIPLGCLQVPDHDDLFVAGRCISVDHDAQASIRVMGTCFATGQVAGLAASIQSSGGNPKIVPAELVRKFGPFPVAAGDRDCA